MKKQDELDLWNEIKDIKLNEVIDFGKLAKKLKIPDKRMNYILEKWNSKGILNCGVSCWFSWKEKNSIN